MKKKPLALVLALCLLVTVAAVYAEETMHTVPSVTLLSNGGSILMDGGDEDDYEMSFSAVAMEPGQAFGETLGLDRIIAMSKDGKMFVGWTLYDVFELETSETCVEEEGTLCFELFEDYHMVLRSYTAHNELLSTQKLAEYVCGECDYVVAATWMTAEEYLAFVKEQSDAIKTSLEQDPLTQTDMNQKSEALRTLWDEALNLLLDEATKLLPEAEAAQLMAEQGTWKTDVEAAAEAAGKEFEGGSMYPLIVNTEAARLIEERVYKLYELLK